MHSESYKDYRARCDYRDPDIVAFLGASFRTLEPPYGEYGGRWHSEVPYMLPESGAPFFFTSNKAHDAQSALEKVKGVLVEKGMSDVKFEVECQHNPFQSYRPFRDWDLFADSDSDVFYNNLFYSVLRRVPKRSGGKRRGRNKQNKWNVQNVQLDFKHTITISWKDGVTLKSILLRWRCFQDADDCAI